QAVPTAPHPSCAEAPRPGCSTGKKKKAMRLSPVSMFATDFPHGLSSEVGVNISDFPLGVCSPRRDLQSGLIPTTTTRPSAPQLCLCRAAKSPGCQQLPESLPEAKLVSEGLLQCTGVSQGRAGSHCMTPGTCGFVHPPF
uniref:Uncharacterized protein n=1 Tax=Anas platyrhynchos platyrhynchos TaxID=8840 RepID=A0A493TWX4_ANAPP